MIDDTIKQFQATIWDYYHDHGRHDLPWRRPAADGSFAPYDIVVSELMLQQTQVARVITKYNDFLRTFPTVFVLAKAPLSEVLRSWNGLGYNRRAKFLHESAQQVVDDYDGIFPNSEAELTALPGVGHNTAGAILAYAFNQPVCFLETNIRTVFIHHFFPDQAQVPDAEILHLVDKSLEREQVREWYWALMDYGAYLKQTVGNLNQRSTSYVKQSKFAGSKRQARGQILSLLGDRPYSKTELKAAIVHEHLLAALDDLLAEHMIQMQGNRFHL